MAVFDTHQEKKEQQSKSGPSGAGGSQQKSEQGGGGKSGGGDGGGDDPVKTAAQAIVDYASDPALLGPNQQLRDLVEGLKKALADAEQK